MDCPPLGEMVYLDLSRMDIILVTGFQEQFVPLPLTAEPFSSSLCHPDTFRAFLDSAQGSPFIIRSSEKQMQTLPRTHCQPRLWHDSSSRGWTCA
jgi:hypothetical protein